MESMQEKPVGQIEERVTDLKTDTQEMYYRQLTDFGEQKVTEERLRFQSSLLENVSDAIISFTLSYKVLSWNKAAEAIYGWTDREAIGKSVAEIFHTETLPALADMETQLLKKGYWRGELLQRRKDGTPVDIYASATLLRNSEGRPVGLVTVNRDISERKKAEQALQESEKRFRLLAENTSDLIALHDAKGCFLYVSPSCSMILGYTPEELTGKLLADLVHPSHTVLISDSFATLSAESVATENRIAYQIRQKTGGYVWFETSMRPIVAEADGSIQLVTSSRNITEEKNAQLALRESEARLRLITDTTPAILWTTDQHLHFTSITGAGLKTLRLQPHHLIGKPISAFITTANLSSSPVEAHRRALRGETFVYEQVWSGQTHQVHLEPLRDPSGHIIGSIGIALDITQRKQTEIALSASEKRFRLLSENSPDTICILDLIKQKASYVNRTEFLGYSTDEISQITSLFDITHPDDQEKVYAHWHQLLTNVDFKPDSIEYRVRSKEGDWEWLQVRETILSSDRQGTPTQILVTLTVITDRKRTEEALHISQERYSLATRASQVGVWEWNIDTSEMYISPNLKLVLGYEEFEIRDHYADWHRLIYEEDKPAVSEAFNNCIRGLASSLELEYRMVHKDGSLRWTLTRGSVIFDHSNHPYRVIGTNTDITASKEAERQALELMIEKEQVNVLQQFIADTSHDLKTPIAVIQSELFLLDKISPDDQQKRRLDVIRQQSEHLNRRLEDMLNMFRVDMRTNWDFTPVNLAPFVHNVLSEHEAVFRKKNHTMEYHFDAVASSVKLDVVYFTRAFTNILMNATKYTPEGGTITVRTYGQDKYGVIEVQDTGIGISKEDLPNIFKRFYRGDKARNRDTGGSGLGLAIARKIVEAHHGSIEVESELGTGSVFRILLPLQP